LLSGKKDTLKFDNINYCHYTSKHRLTNSRRVTTRPSKTLVI